LYSLFPIEILISALQYKFKNGKIKNKQKDKKKIEENDEVTGIKFQGKKNNKKI